MKILKIPVPGALRFSFSVAMPVGLYGTLWRVNCFVAISLLNGYPLPAREDA
ncbi:hypothetical protein J5X98_11730 [Leptothermofonsia sichuanensis E412]|uniref:hypothetical protein n=1 Tax=Leptothermofonsia sichuanensis TaxID=2917832 RepID=UPI001CA707E5|nr:hypothetical protein [Leptothermofonsia sichuanensis]QZZ22949.1 hypothetical protein J5X98_11730 [Leptothermofonsia sichuanensis E412]